MLHYALTLVLLLGGQSTLQILVGLKTYLSYLSKA